MLSQRANASRRSGGAAGLHARDARARMMTDVACQQQKTCQEVRLRSGALHLAENIGAGVLTFTVAAGVRSPK